MIGFLLILVPEINNPDQCTAYKPFGEDSLEWIMNEAIQEVLEGYEGVISSEPSVFYRPYPYYFSGENAAKIKGEYLKKLEENAHLALIDFRTLDLENPDLFANNQSILNAFGKGPKSAVKQCALIKNKYYKENVKQFIRAFKRDVGSDDVLESLFVSDLFNMIGEPYKSSFENYPK